MLYVQCKGGKVRRFDDLQEERYNPIGITGYAEELKSPKVPEKEIGSLRTMSGLMDGIERHEGLPEKIKSIYSEEEG